MEVQKSDSWRTRVKQAFNAPNGKQREAFGRFFHTISIACLVGTATVIFAVPPHSFWVLKTVVLMVCFAVAFTAGSIFSKGE